MKHTRRKTGELYEQPHNNYYNHLFTYRTKMKKGIALILVSILSITMCIAQENNGRGEKKIRELKISAKKSGVQPSGNKQVKSSAGQGSTDVQADAGIADNSNASANGYSGKWKNNYMNIGFTNTAMSQDGIQELKSNYGASLAVGRTFYLHEEPFADIMRFGIDITWLDLNYTNYKIKHITDSGSNEFQYHQTEVGVQAGPSITIKADEKLYIHAYFRYAPSYSFLHTDEETYSNYATFFVGGSTVSYGNIGVGIEARFGSCRHNGIEPGTSPFLTDEARYSGFNIFMNFRF